MKFSVGYQLLYEEDGESFADIIKDYRDRIEDVYFPWLDLPSGRAPLNNQRGHVDWRGQEILESDLNDIRSMGVKLHLLLNASCYGKYNISSYLSNYICSVLSYLSDTTGCDTVTTMSPLIAKTVKRHFPDIEVRASVNMKIGTVKGMEYVADMFDSYNIQREFNRDPARINELRKWANANGKKLYILVNSGCMNFCSFQTFHDNTVSHEKDVNETINEKDIASLCKSYYKDKGHWVNFLQGSWIRPEDIPKHKKHFSGGLKLATRMHSNPRMVIDAYCSERYCGNLLDLMEPGHGPAFMPYIIDNAKFPEDWHDKVTNCDKNCSKCDYCSRVLEKVLI